MFAEISPVLGQETGRPVGGERLGDAATPGQGDQKEAREETGVPGAPEHPRIQPPAPGRSLQLAADAESTYSVPPAKYRLSHRPALLSNVMTVNHHLKTSTLLTKLEQGR